MGINVEVLASNHLRAVRQAESHEVRRMYFVEPLPQGGFHFLSMLVDSRGEQGEARYEKARDDGFCETKEEAFTNALQYCAKRYAAEVAQLADWGAEIGMVIEPFGTPSQVALEKTTESMKDGD